MRVCTGVPVYLCACVYMSVLVCHDLQFPKFEFPKALSGCIRECFLRLECIDPELPPRLVEFLAYHLSNFDYQWPWPR